MFDNEFESKTDSNGLEYTTERGFGQFVYEYLKAVGAATTGDIIEHVRKNFDFLEGDEVKTSETRSAPRFRQTVDNLIKCHGTIIRMFDDVRDFPGGIALTDVELSEELLERAKSEMSAQALAAERRRLEEQERLRKEQKEINKRSEAKRVAMFNAKSWKSIILQAAKAEGLDLEEIKEDFEDIVEDVAHRHPGAIDSKEKFVEAFISEC